GVARTADAALTKKGQFLGTPCYAAPETLTDGEYGPKTDLFSFAAVLYELATGTRAFPGTDAVAVAHKVVHDTPPMPSDVAKGEPIPEGVDDILMQGLSKTPDERFDSAAEFADALRGAYLDAGVIAPTAREASRSFAVRQTTKAPARRRSPLAFAAVLGGGLLVGIAVVVAVSDTSGSGEVQDAGTEAAGPDASLDAEASVPDATRDADAAEPVIVIGDAAMEDADAEPDAEEMTSHEREEAAKDAIDAARRAIDDGDVDAAATYLDRALTLDPENDDIDALEAAISSFGS
ncbi:MAG: protein kinase, partial [Myxococcota bacterium]